MNGLQVHCGSLGEGNLVVEPLGTRVHPHPPLLYSLTALGVHCYIQSCGLVLPMVCEVHQSKAYSSLLGG